MIKRFLCCLTGLLAAAWLAHAEPPDAALPVPANEPRTVQEHDDTQPDPNAPWPAPPAPAYSGAPAQAPLYNGVPVLPGSAVVPVGGPEPPGILAEPVTTQPMGPSDPVVPVQSARPRWLGLFGRSGSNNALEPQPAISEFSQGQVGQLPPPTPGQPSSPTEPLRLPEGTEPAVPALAEPAPVRPPGRFWITGEFLLWLEPAAKVNYPLATTGNATTTEPPGAVGNSDTTILFSTNNQLNNGNLPGGRFTVGGWFTQDWIIGAEVSAFFVGSTGLGKLFSPGETSTGVIARPFINALTGNTSSAVVSFPDDFSGLLHIDSQSRLFGGEANLIGKLCREEHYDVDIIVGYRFLELAESVQFNQAAVTEQDGVLAFDNVLLPSGTTVTFLDRFATRDEFQGAQIGIQSTHHYGGAYLKAFAKFAVGPTERIIENSGLTTMTPAGGTTSSLPGGIFVVPPANMGRFEDTKVTLVTNCGFKLGYHCSDCFEIFAGYEIVIFPDVVRASDQINPVINPELIPTFLGYNPNAAPHEPTVPFISRTYWAQGINVGFEVKW